MTANAPNQLRRQIKSGIRVKIVLKENQRSGILTLELERHFLKAI
jgi:uncharacterized protein YwbE